MSMTLTFSTAQILITVLNIALIAALIWLAVLCVRALRRYLHSADVRTKKEVIRRSLGEVIKTCRMEHGMTQEFVAESLGVSRQAVSKWESGISDPSTANLFALADLFGVPADEMLRGVQK